MKPMEQEKQPDAMDKLIGSWKAYAGGSMADDYLVFNNEKEKAPDADNAAIKPDKPGTGDSGNRLPWLCLLAAGAIVCLTAATGRKRQHD